MSTRTRRHPHPLTCYACWKLIPAGEPAHLEVGFFTEPPPDPDEAARRKTYEQSLSDRERASLTRLRAVFGAMGGRRGWRYGVFCHACKETSFKRGLQEHDPLSAAKQARHPTGLSKTFQQHLDLECRQQPCRGCGRPIYWRKGYRMPRGFCGDGCRTLYKRRLRLAQASEKEHEMACAECGEPFRARRNDAKYCSPRCRQRARRTKHRLETCADIETT